MTNLPSLLALLAEDEIQAHAANFHLVTVLQLHRALDWHAIYRGHFITGAQIITVIVLIDLRRHFWLKPSTQAHRSQVGFSYDRQLAGQSIFLLVGFAAENPKR